MKKIEQIISDIDKIQIREEKLEQKLNEGFLNAAKNFFSTIAGFAQGKSLDQIKQDRFDSIKAKNDKISDSKKRNLNRLYYISSLFDEITDNSGKNYSITGSINDGIAKFEAALKSDKFSDYDLKTAKYIEELLDSGHKKELLKLNDLYLSTYAKSNKNLTEFISDLIDNKINSSNNDNSTNEIDLCLKLIEKIIEQVRFNIPANKAYAFGLSVQDYFNNGRASKKTYDYNGVQLDFSEIFKKLCDELKIDSEKCFNIYRKLYVNNNINTTHIYQINKFGTYTDYVNAYFNKSVKSIDSLIIATLEYSIIDIVRMISEKYLQNAGTNILKDMPLRQQFSKIYMSIQDEGLLTDTTIKHLYYVCTSVSSNGSFNPTNNGGSYFNTEITLKLERLIQLKNIEIISK